MPIYENITFVPCHTLILDRSNCPSVPSPTSPTTSTPPTFSPGPDASDTCQRLFDIAKENTQEPFVCEVVQDGDDCSTLKCRLDVGGSSYTIVIEMRPPASKVVVSVTVTQANGTVLASQDVTETKSFSVTISEGKLTFSFNMQQENAVGMKVYITQDLCSLLLDSQKVWFCITQIIMYTKLLQYLTHRLKKSQW